VLFLDIGSHISSFVFPQRFALLWSFDKHFPKGKKGIGQRLELLARSRNLKKKKK